ncbi:TRAP transporter small permease [Chachezhania sediminis]|uniref:TRAP transporter small permease n=1 Tax=Chachezhania sediminis TaxID=2599291 RepID=UPI00131B620B|nr:TRAP transporter small permease [Chachezhania sediminis]
MAQDTATLPAGADLPRGAIHRILDVIARLCLTVAGIQMVTLIVIFGWLVFGRYVLNDTPTWVEQAALLLVVWIVFLGGAVGVWRGSHLSVDFVREMMPRVPKEILRLVSILLMIFFGTVMAWQGWGLAQKTWPRMVPMLDISEAWRAIPMAVFGVLCVLFSLAHLADYFKRLAEGRD